MKLLALSALSIDPMQVCECRPPRRSGRFYLGFQACDLCDGLMLRDREEARALEAQRLAIDVREGRRGPADLPEIGVTKTYRFLLDALEANPSLSNNVLRSRLADIAIATFSDTTFYALVAQAREELRVEPAPRPFRRNGAA